MPHWPVSTRPRLAGFQVSTEAGLYFLGLHWMHTIGSAAFFGVGNDAAFIAEHMRRHH
jgi:hypothetical protein